MADDRIREMITLLDAEVAAADRAKLRITECDAPQCVLIRGNRAGLVQAAQALLRAALEPIDSAKGCSKPVALGDGFEQLRYDPEMDRVIVGIQRTQTWPEPAGTPHRDARWRGRAALLGCGIVACILLAVFVAGLVTIFRSL
ncbi:MAG: hypothetical protein LLG00_11305 [Planctomycetaceae bacterium]|nr:hypothetical protein [Planctomycetaceae bacterium]